MKPTQAQINAAKIKIASMRTQDFSAKEIAEAALTAAAEMGEQEKHDAQVDRYVTLGNAMKMQIIERCIQKIELFIVNNRISGQVQDLINEIRAMKDE